MHGGGAAAPRGSYLLTPTCVCPRVQGRTMPSNPKPPFNPRPPRTSNVKEEIRKRGRSVEDYLQQAFVAQGAAGRPRHALLRQSPRRARATLSTCAASAGACAEGGRFADPYFALPLPGRPLGLRLRQPPPAAAVGGGRDPCASARGGRAAGELTFPQGVALAPRGLYVADACRVQLLDHEMRFVAEIGAGGALDHACGVAVAADGRIFVSDQEQCRVVAFAADGGEKPVLTFGKRGYRAGELYDPRGLAVHGAEVWVADSCNHRLAVFAAADGAYIKRVGEAGDRPGQFRHPSGVGFSGGLVFVSEYGGGRLQVLNTNGACVQLVVPPAAGASLGALGVRDGRVAVVDTNCRLHVYAIRHPTAAAPRRSAIDATPPRVADGATHERAGSTRARVERAMAAADWAGVLKELEPADIRLLVAASYADAAAHPEVYADLHGRVEVDRETGATRERGGPSSENSYQLVRLYVVSPGHVTSGLLTRARARALACAHRRRAAPTS